MAKKIKGIVVQIGGDTSGLSKALASADKSLIATQKELNQVQKGLKLDPSNAELVRQKHELLSDAIKTTADKLKVLEENQEKAKRAFDANDEWEKKFAPLGEQIDKATASLKALKAKQKEAEEAFKAGTISTEDYDKIQADVKAAEKTLADLKKQKEKLNAEFKDGHITAEEYREYQREVENTRSHLQNLQTELRNTSRVSQEQKAQITEFGNHAKETFAGVVKAVAAITAALIAVGKQVVETGAEFDKSMSQVAATMGYSVDEINTEGSEAAKTFDKLRNFAQDMGKSTAFSANEASQALNYMALAGYDADKSMAMLPKVLDLASAGNIELAKSSDMVTDAQSALGLSVEETEIMIDQMAKTSARSNTSVEQLGEGILTLGATGKTVKGGTKELAQTLGLLADNGIKGSEGGTKLRNIILALQAPTEKATKELDKLGVSAFDSEGKFRSLQDIFYDFNVVLSDMSDKDAAIAKSTIFSKRDIAAVNALLGTSVDRWNQLGAEIEDSAGAAHDMAETQLDNLAGDVTLFKSALEGAEITISDKLTPSLRNAVQFGTEAVGKLADGFGEGGLAGAVAAAHKLIEEKLGEDAKIIYGVEAATEAAVAAFVTYKATMLLSEGITALKTVNTLLAEGKTLTEALNATAAVNPYVLIATAAIGAGVAIKKLIDIQTDLIDEAVDSYDLLSDKQKTAVDNTRNLAKTVGDSRRKWQENRDALEKQALTAKGLAEQLYQLDEAEKLSNADKEKMKAIVKELNQSVDGLNIKLDEETGHLITQKSTIDALISSYERQAKTQAAQERLTELYKEQFDAEKSLEEITREREGAYNALSQKQLELFSAQKEYNELLAQDTGTIFSPVSIEQLSEAAEKVERLTQEEKDLQDVVGTTNASFDSASRATRSVSDGIEEMTGILVENGAQVQTSAEAMEGSFDDLAGAADKAGSEIVQAFDVEEEIENAVNRIEEIIKAYDSKLEARTGTLQNWFAVNATVSAEDASFSSFSSALDKQISDMEEWSAGIARLEKEGINQNFLDQLKDAGPASLEYVKALLDVPAEDRNAYAKKWYKAYEGAAKTAEEQLKAMHDSSNKEIEGILKDAGNKGADFETVFRNLAINASNGYLEGLRNKLSEVKEAAKALADATSGTVESELEIESPSKVMRKIGKYAGEGLSLGIEDEVSSAVKASQMLVDSVIGAGNSAIKDIEIPKADMSAAAQTARSYRAAQSGTSVSQTAASTADTADTIKQAFSGVISGNVEVVIPVDGERFARAIFPKIDLLQGQKLIEVEGGYANV